VADLKDTRKDPNAPPSTGRGVNGPERFEQKLKELAVFRDAGVLTEAELEEQKAKLRWGLA
jgi:hypothetical protein